MRRVVAQHRRAVLAMSGHRDRGFPCGAVDSCTTARLARAGNREAAEWRWRCCPRLFLGGEAWWRGHLEAFDRAGATRAPPGPLTKSRIMS